jgi:hypothetical protein
MTLAATIAVTLAVVLKKSAISAVSKIFLSLKKLLNSSLFSLFFAISETIRQQRKSQ